MVNNLLLVLSVMIGSVGQIMFKKGMMLMKDTVGSLSLGNLPSFLFKLISSPAILIGMFCYIGSTVIWLYVLSKVDLNRVYPFTALTFVMVFLASMLIFHEQIPPNRFVGLGIIVTGFLVTSIK